MLIDFFRQSDEKRIYQFDSDRNYTTFSSNNNLMFSKDSYADAARYQLHHKYREDVYLCLANIKQKNRYMINPKINIRHFPRVKVKDLFSQFFHYGRYFSEGTSAIDYRGLELFAHFVITPRLYKRGILMKARFPFGLLLFLSFFHLLLLSTAAALLFPGTVTRALFLAGLALYLASDFRMLTAGAGAAFKLAVARFCINCALLLGNIAGSIAQRKLIFGPLIEACQNNVVYVKKSAKFPIPTDRQLDLAIGRMLSLPPTQWDALEIESAGGPYYVVRFEDAFFLLTTRAFFVGYELVSVAKNRFDLLLGTR